MMPEIATTAEIQIAPEIDVTVQSLVEEARKLQTYAEGRMILSDDDLKPVLDDLTLIAKVKRALEEKKKEYLKPIKAHVEAISATFQAILGPLEDADRLNRSAMMRYRAEQQRKADEAEAINREKEALAKREAALNYGAHTVDLTPVEAPVPIAKVRTDMGTAGVTKIKKWVLEDMAKVPDEYKVLDSGRITRVVKAGGSIPGIRVFEEESLRVVTR